MERNFLQLFLEASSAVTRFVRSRAGNVIFLGMALLVLVFGIGGLLGVNLAVAHSVLIFVMGLGVVALVVAFVFVDEPALIEKLLFGARLRAAFSIPLIAVPASRADAAYPAAHRPPRFAPRA